MIKYKLYDLLTSTIIEIDEKGVKKRCESLDFDYTALSKMGGNNKCIKSRYVLDSTRDKIFTIVDIDSGKEYECINNTTIFHHLNIPYNANEAKYVYELKIGRQKTASIAGLIFYLKGNNVSDFKFSGTNKNKSIVVQSALDERRICNKIKQKISTKIYQEMVANNAKFTKNTIKILGCTKQEFKRYIEMKFTPGMSWSNYGKEWHFDHIICCRHFDLSKENEVYKCFNYTNYQPMWRTTELAVHYGENNYVGNMNKNFSGDMIDYNLRDIIYKTLKVNSEFEKDQLYEMSGYMSEFLHLSGIRKVIDPDNPKYL